MVSRAQRGVALLGSRQSMVQIVHVVLEAGDPTLGRIHDRFGRRPRLRWVDLVAGGEGIAVDERVPRSSTFDLPQPHQVPALEVPVAVFEFPERRIRRARVEDVADWRSADE